MAIRRGLGRAWGNALGGWRKQRRNGRGQFMGKFGADMRYAHKIGSMSAYRNTYKSAGLKGTKQGALGAAHYTLGALNAARTRGYFVNPEIGLSGAGISVGYGQKVSPNLRASISVKVAINRTDGGPIQVAAKSFIDNSFGQSPGLQSLLQYGVMDTKIHDTVIVRNGDKLQMKSGRKANAARNKNPAYRAKAATDKAKKKPYRAERRKSGDIGNGHKIVKGPDRWDETKHKNKYGTYTQYKQVRQNPKTKAKKKHNSKQIASTITR